MARTWKSTNGTEIEGEVFQVKDERVGLRIDGRDYFFSISRFQKADQIYLRKWGAEERCGSCAGKINGEFREAGDKKYHRQCFRCLACRKVFEGEIGWPRIPGVAWFTWTTSRVFLLAIVARDSFEGMRRIQGNFFGMAG